MTATIEPNPGFWVKEFSIGSASDDNHRTYYEDANGDGLVRKVAENPATVGAVVAVTLDIDEGEHHLVQVETRRPLSGTRDQLACLAQIDAMTQAAEAILRVRDQLLNMHGHASIEEYQTIQ